MSEKRTIGQIIGQWLNNWVIFIGLIGTGGAAIYGNSETAKSWVHDQPLKTEVKPVKTITLEQLNKRIDSLQQQVNKNKRWHE